MIFECAIAFALTVSALLFKRSKAVTILFFCFMWLLFGWNYYNGDYDAYETMYNNPIFNLDISQYEVGFRAIILWFNLLGFTFQEFYIIISLAILILWLRFILKFSSTPALFTICFFWFFFPLDYVLFRNFLAISIFLQGLYSVFINSKYKYIKFLFAVILASFIHSSSIFYAIMFLAFILKPLSVNKTIILIVVFTMFFFLFGRSFVGQIGSVLGTDRLDYYTSTPGVFVINSFFQIINVYSILCFYSIKGRLHLNHSNIDTYILNINVLLLLLIISYAFVAITVRVFRHIAIINIIYMLNNMQYLKSQEYRWQYKLLLLLYVISFVRFYILYLDDTIYSLFKYNLIFP
ncbi:EpsG family protein [Bacteroides sp. GD17]|jgi:hypothetical protein|uniref:EpsG family protein n=1 Tax=Bacteroides sp. GD17 TaxID=3139826 RepID=UPI00313D54C4